MALRRAPVAGYTPLIPGRAVPRAAEQPPLEGCSPVLLAEEAFAKHTLQSSATAIPASGWMYGTEPEVAPWWQLDLGGPMFLGAATVWLAPLPEGTEVDVLAYGLPMP